MKLVGHQPDARPPRRVWAIRHNGGILGYAKSRAEAEAIVRDLQDWIEREGGRGELDVTAPPADEWRSQ
jgi:hypothetical protein